MNRLHVVKWAGGIAVALALVVLGMSSAHATINGVSGTSFSLTARDGFISTPEANSIYVWGYANGAGVVQYPGPTLIVNQGATVIVTLTNNLSVPVSIVFPGQEGVTARGGTPGLLAREALPGGSVTYTFTAANAGTYLYNSGTRPELQVEMGLVGALIVRPAGYDSSNPRAYYHADSSYDHEYLFLLGEMDPVFHELVKFGNIDQVDNTTYWPVYWFINGRCAPDTLAADDVPWLPTQPYSCMPRMTPGEKILLRFIGAGRDPHPFHPHGNNSLVIARDGRLLESVPGVSGPDLAVSDFTLTVSPGATYDATFEWTGEKLGWDIYGHSAGDPLEPNEYAPDHGKPFPVTLPEQKDLTFGAFYSGSPYMGTAGVLPPGEGGFNPNAGFFFMWHSHNEKEMVNNDIFPGGLMTMFVVEPPGVTIP